MPRPARIGYQERKTNDRHPPRPARHFSVRSYPMSGEPHAPLRRRVGVRGDIARSCAARTPHPDPPPQGGRGRMGFFVRCYPMSGEESGGVPRGCVGGMGQRFGVGTGLRVSARRSREDVTEDEEEKPPEARPVSRHPPLSSVTPSLLLRAEIRASVQTVAAARRTNTIFARSYPMSGERDAPGWRTLGMGLGGGLPLPPAPSLKGRGGFCRASDTSPHAGGAQAPIIG